jgi:hypothetical protein
VSTPIELIDQMVANLKASDEYGYKSSSRGKGQRYAVTMLEELREQIEAQDAPRFCTDSLTGVMVQVVRYGSVTVTYDRDGTEFTLPRPAFDARYWRCPCPTCNDTFVICVAGPDRDGNYDTDDCPCQTVRS